MGCGLWWVEVTGTEVLAAVSSGWQVLLGVSARTGKFKEGGFHLWESHQERSVCSKGVQLWGRLAGVGHCSQGQWAI